MPIRIGEINRGELLNVTLPTKTESYTVISYNHVILTILGALSDNGFNVESEKYYATNDGNIASGVFIINSKEDADLKMVYSFTNSYNKQVRFKCAIGGFISSNGSYLIHNLLNFNRTHRSNADELMEENIKDHIFRAGMYFEELVKFKNKMQEIEVTKEDFASIVTVLYMNGHLGLEQFAEAVREYQKPKNNYTLGLNNLWTLYSIISYSLRVTHPRKWLASQQELSLYFSTKYNLEIFNDEENVDDKLQTTESELNEEEDMLEIHEEVLTEEEVVSQLYGVDNNPEATFANDIFAEKEETANTESIVAEEQTEKVSSDVEVDTKQILPGFKTETCPKHEDVEESDTQEHEVVSPPDDVIADINAVESVQNNVPEEEDVFEDSAGFTQADNIVEKESPFIDGTPQEVPEEEQGIYIHSNVMPGLKKGDVFETELVDEGLSFLEVTKIFKDVNKDIYYICKIIKVDESEEESDVVFNEPTEQNKIEEVENTIEETIETEEETTTEETIEEVVEDTPFIKAVKDEIEDLFGMVHNFTHTIVDGQINIVLETGESFTVTESYINLKINKKYNIGNE